MGIELEKTRVFGILYTGGDFALSSNGEFLFTTCTNIIKVLNVNNGAERFFLFKLFYEFFYRLSIGDIEQDPRISSFVLNEDNSEILIAYSNDVIKHYKIDINSDSIVVTFKKQFRGTHKAPILVLKLFNHNGKSILATGSSDFSVKIWDLDIQSCTHNFLGKAVVTSLCFVENGRKILTGYNEGQVRMFDLTHKGSNQRLMVEWFNHTRYYFIFSV